MVFAGKEAESCKDKVAELNKIVAELGPLIKAAQIVVGDAASAQAKQYGLDGDKLGIDPCALDIVLLPFDEDKGSPEDWQHYAGAQTWSLHPLTKPASCQCSSLQMCFTCSTPVQALPNGEDSATYAYIAYLALLLVLSRASHIVVLCCRRPE